MPATGTIKIAKAKTGKTYIYAYLRIKNYELPKKMAMISQGQTFQPFPIVEGHSFPFNYTSFFTDCFNGQAINLEDKNADTAYFELHVSAKGKVFVRETSAPKKGTAYYEVAAESSSSVYVNPLHMRCIEHILSIKEWFPAYYEQPQKDKFRGEVVIKPNKTNVACTGIITIIFSKEPF